MKKILLGLILLTSNSFAAEYRGKNILNYIPVGIHQGHNCSVEVDDIAGNIVVSVHEGNAYATFNSSVLKKNDIFEKTEANEYSASFTMSPNNSYSGKRSNYINIKMQRGGATVSLEMARFFVGYWKIERRASCRISL
jgi:hypothetical protein